MLEPAGPGFEDLLRDMLGLVHVLVNDAHHVPSKNAMILTSTLKIWRAGWECVTQLDRHDIEVVVMRVAKLDICFIARSCLQRDVDPSQLSYAKSCFKFSLKPGHEHP